MMGKCNFKKKMMLRVITKVLNRSYGHEDHLVCFGLKDVGGKTLIAFKDEACYRKLAGPTMHKYKDYIDTIWTKITLGDLAKKHLKNQCIISYLREAYNAKLLPAYVSYNNIYDPSEGSLNLSLKYKALQNPQELYTYLSIVRHIREDPGLVIAVNRLIDYGFSFYAAFVIANTFVVEFGGHDILGLASYYRVKCNSDEKVKIYLAEALKIAAKEFDNNIKGKKDNSTFDVSNVVWDIYSYYEQKAGNYNTVTVGKLFSEPEKY